MQPIHGIHYNPGMTLGDHSDRMDRTLLSFYGLAVGDFQEAMWATVSGLGDRDTTCAIVGSIVPLARGWSGLPTTWYRNTESVVVEVK